MTGYRQNYNIVNITLFIVFLIGLIYVVFSSETVVCYYVKNFNQECTSCGLTRDFKSIIKLDFNCLINPHSFYYFSALAIIFFSRIGVFFGLKSNASVKKIFYIDMLIAMLVTILFSATIFNN